MKDPYGLHVKSDETLANLAGQQQITTFSLMASSIKLMIVGDSITQGREGDFTWRYRLWEWLNQESIHFHFVGPYEGTKTPDKPRPPQQPALEDGSTLDNHSPIDRGGYAAGVHFDSRHFSVWGQQATQCADLVRAQVAQFRPDYMLVMLGFNDMGWGVTDAKGTIFAMKELIDEARAAKPDLKFAIADVPQRTPIDGTEKLIPMIDRYNRLLRVSAKEWRTQGSPVELVYVRDSYECARGSYDGLHPNGLGEYQIAKAFSQSLIKGYGVGTNELKVPKDIPQRPTPVPAKLVAATVSYGIAVTWESVYGALGYDVRSGTDENSSWHESRTEVNRYDSTWTQEGQVYRYQIRTYNGDDLRSAWSKLVTAIAHPKTASGPRNIVTKPDANQVVVQWEELPGQLGIDRYEIILADQSQPGSFPSSFGVKGTTTTLKDLVSGHQYSLAISTWTQHGGGLPATGRSFIAGHGKPPIPRQLHVKVRNPTTVHLEWEGSDGAAGYRVWVRNRVENSNFTEDGETESTEYGITFLILGVWNFEFCVTAYNGNLESEYSTCVVPPRSGADPNSAVEPLG